MLKNMITMKNNALDRFMSYSMHHRVRIQEVLNNKWSETSNSMYTLLRDRTGQIYELAISDHPGHSHRHPMSNFVGNYASLNDLRSSMKRVGVTMPSAAILSPDNFYSINPCRPYRMNPKELVGRRSSHLAFISDCYRVKDALLLHDKQILALTYSNEDGSREEQAIYVNYDPIQKGCSERDLVAIQYLKRNYDIKTARRIYFHGWYHLMTRDEYEDDLSLGSANFHRTPNVISNHQYQNVRQAVDMATDDDDGREEFENDGTAYVFWLTVADPRYIHN